MQIFEIELSRQQAITVFARSYEEAVGIFMTYWVTNRHLADLPDIDVKKRNPTWPGLDVAMLAEALDRGVAGVARLDAKQGWVILPADHRVEEVAA